RIDHFAEQQQIEIERPRRETLAAAQAPAFVFDVEKLALDVVGRDLYRERNDDVQEVGPREAERRAAIDVRAAHGSEAGLEHTDRVPEMAFRLDVAAGTDIDVNHSPRSRAR